MSTKIKKGKIVAHAGKFTFAKDKKDAIKKLKEKGLTFGWFNGEFITTE